MFEPEVFEPRPDTPRPIDKFRFVRASDKEIVTEYLQAQAEYPTMTEETHIARVALRCEVTPEVVTEVVKKAQLRAFAKQTREQVLNEVYKDKLPMAKAILGLSLEKLEQFVSMLGPEDLRDLRILKILESLTTNIHSIIRLEENKSTANVAMGVEVGQKSIKALIDELKNTDPFVDYPEGEKK